MKFFVLLFLAVNLISLNAMEDNGIHSCYENIAKSVHTSTFSQKIYSSLGTLYWLDGDKLILQKSERAHIYHLKIDGGLNHVRVYNRQGELKNNICMFKLQDSIFIQSIGNECEKKIKNDKFITDIYPYQSVESQDLLSYKSLELMLSLRKSFDKNINTNNCDQYIKTYKSCRMAYLKSTHMELIPQTERSFFYTLKSLGKSLRSYCRII